ncbi:MAG: hypothetical protein ACMUIP_00640 [bacterium]
MTKRRIYHRVILAVLIMGMVVMGLYCLYEKYDESQDTKSNPYEYPLDEFVTTAPDLVLFAEQRTIPLLNQELYAIAVGPEDTIYVAADTSIIVFRSSGEKIDEFPLDAAAQCLSVDPNEQIYCGMGDHVALYDRSGRKQSVWGSLGERAMITAIALWEHHVCIADAGNRLVWHFDSSGRLYNQIGRAGQSLNKQHFIIPSPYFDCAFSLRHTLLVTNPGKLRIEEYTLEGKLIASWGNASMRIEDFAGCCNPIHIAVREDGSIVTSEKGIPRVKLYSHSGQFIGVVAAPPALFSEDSHDLDCAVTTKGEVCVLDPKARVIRMFLEKKREEHDSGK